MILDTTSKEMRIVLGEGKTTNDCDVVTSYADCGVSFGTFVFGNQNTLTNGTTPVVVVAAPDALYQRQVKEIRLFNNDTVTHTVTLQLYDGTDTWIVAPSALSVAPGGSYVYTPDVTTDGTGTVTIVTTSGGSTGLSLTTSNPSTTPSITLGGTLAVASGGTGATTATAALANLGAVVGSGTATATGSGSSGAATLNESAGVITSQALVAATTYALTLTNSRITSASTIIISASNSAGLVTWPVAVVCSAGSAVITVGMATLTGTVVISFVVVN